MQVKPDILNNFDEHVMLTQLKRELENIASESSKGASDIEFLSQNLNSSSVDLKDFID